MQRQDNSTVYLYLLDTGKEQSDSLFRLIPVLKERYQHLITPEIISSSTWWIRRKVLGWALLDYVLSQEANISLNDCTIEEREHGKPEITNIPFLHYNLSHSGPYFLLGLNRFPLGVDIEIYRKIPEHLAKRVFTPSEQNDLRNKQDPLYNQAFLQVWTKKESFSKAMGTGFQAVWNTIQTNQSIKPYQWFTESKDNYVFSVCCQESETIAVQPVLTMSVLADFYLGTLPS